MRWVRTLTFVILGTLALLSVAVALAASPKKGGIYVGKTEPFSLPQVGTLPAQDVVIEVSKSGKKVVFGTHTTLMLACPAGSPRGLVSRGSPSPKNVPIKNGKFSYKGKEADSGPLPVDDAAMSGTFKKGGRVTGKASYSHPSPEGGACSNETTYTAKLTKKKPPSGGR